MATRIPSRAGPVPDKGLSETGPLPTATNCGLFVKARGKLSKSIRTFRTRARSSLKLLLIN